MRDEGMWRIMRLVISVLAVGMALYLIDTSAKVELVLGFAAAFGQGVSAATGKALGYFCLVGGAAGIYTYVKQDARGMLAGAVCYMLGVLLSLNVGVYTDLYLFDAVAVVFAVLTILPWLRQYRAKKTADGGDQ